MPEKEKTQVKNTAKLPPPKTSSQEKISSLSDEERNKITSALNAILEMTIPAAVKTFVESALIILDPKVNNNILSIDKEIKDFEKNSGGTIKTLPALKKQFETISKTTFKEADFSKSLKIHVTNANNVINKLNDFFVKYETYTKALKEENSSSEKLDKDAVIKSWSEFKINYDKANEDLKRFYTDMKDENKKASFKAEVLWHAAFGG